MSLRHTPCNPILSACSACAIRLQTLLCVHDSPHGMPCYALLYCTSMHPSISCPAVSICPAQDSLKDTPCNPTSSGLRVICKPFCVCTHDSLHLYLPSIVTPHSALHHPTGIHLPLSCPAVLRSGELEAHSLQSNLERMQRLCDSSADLAADLAADTLQVMKRPAVDVQGWDPILRLFLVGLLNAWWQEHGPGSLKGAVCIW